jgi:molecular chaperone DnaK (HSP70)
MPINLRIPLRPVFQRIGALFRSSDHTFDESNFQTREVTAEQFGVVFYWFAQYRFLTLKIKTLDDDTERDFADSSQDVFLLFEQLNSQPDFGCEGPEEEDQFLQDHEWRSALVSRQARIFLEFRIDTDDETFCRMAREAKKAGQAGLLIRIDTLVFDQDAIEPGQIELFLEPVAASPPYTGLSEDRVTEPRSLSPAAGSAGPRAAAPQRGDGIVAVDLGTTTTALAALPAGRLGTEHLNILEVPLVGRADLQNQDCDPVDSVVRLDNVVLDQNQETPDHPDLVRWQVGAAVPQADGDGVIYGVKRLLAGNNWEDRQEVQAALTLVPSPPTLRQPVPLRNRVPAELFLCRLFQRFREAARAYPDRLAVTYPTTFSNRERNQLLQVVDRAWLRMRVHPQTADALAGARQRLELALDEASAAGFFYLYRKIFEAPGGPPAFRYIYPRGLNLLLYDCGGGTTDAALVWAGVPPDQPDTLRIEVRGRTGVRAFGGDNVTCAVFQILKAKIAAELADIRPARGTTGIPPFPADPEEIAGYLRKHAADLNKYVPSAYKGLGGDSFRTNRNHTLELWRMAEKLKRELANADEARLPEYQQGTTTGLMRYLSRGLSQDQLTRLLTALANLVVRRPDVDVLIRAVLQDSIAKCNRLIQEILVEDRQKQGFEPEMVHWVVTAGNGCRYPLIREMLAQQLQVAVDFNELHEPDDGNRKSAVAKGAALALAAQTNIGNLRIEFDKDLCHRLPYDIAYHHTGFDADEYRVLFEKNQRYTEGETRALRILPPRGQAQTFQITLHNRWAGETTWSPHLLFRFPKGIQKAVVTFRYRESAIEADDGHQTVIGEEIVPQEIYRSPVDWGTL